MKGHLTATTSIDNYHANISGHKEQSEIARVLECISLIGACSGRMIFKHMNGQIENSAIARCLNGIKKLTPCPVIVYTDKCKVTGIRVQYYKIAKGQLRMFN